jgi:hypothetical protein
MKQDASLRAQVEGMAEIMAELGAEGGRCQ